jgi:hypothetical protein
MKYSFRHLREAASPRRPGRTLLFGRGLELDYQLGGHPPAVLPSIPCALAHSRTSVLFSLLKGSRTLL